MQLRGEVVHSDPRVDNLAINHQSRGQTILVHCTQANVLMCLVLKSVKKTQWHPRGEVTVTPKLFVWATYVLYCIVISCVAILDFVIPFVICNSL